MYYGYRNRRRSIFLSPIMILLYITIILLVIVYFGISYYFQTHYLPNTTVGNVECGMKTPEYVEKETANQIGRYSLLVKDRKETLYVIEGSKFDYVYVNQGEEEAILESQNAYTWPLALFEDSTYTLSYSVSYDETKLQAMIDKLGIFHEDYIDQPIDAFIQINTDGYTIVPEVMGNVPIAEQISQEIFDAVKSSLTSLTLSSACYVTPNTYSSSEIILNAANTMDNYLKAVITYDIEGSDEVFGKEEIMSALTIDADYQISINTSKIEKYVQHLASTYNTYGDKREFKTSLGDTVIIGGGDYGWVIAKSKEAAQILEDLAGGAPVTREPIYEQTAAQSGLYDIGDTYIEVDYTNQHMWFYKEGELILESDLVSGNMKTGNGSPDGVFKIREKLRNRILVGEDYESPVDYFLTFAYNVGFHDANWRSKFGGDYYLKNGSHGCLNMPYDTVKEMYDIVPKNTPVVAYYREEVVLTSNNCKVSNAYSYKEPVEETTE